MDLSSFDCHIWNHVNERHFHENTILLEVLGRSQGPALRNSVVDDEISQPNSQQWVRPFLDDFALVSAGAGGASNVTAACVEVNPSDPMRFTIRVARNEDYTKEQAAFVDHIISLIDAARQESEETDSNLETECFDVIMKHCLKRVKHLVGGPKGLQELINSSNLLNTDKIMSLTNFDFRTKDLLRSISRVVTRDRSQIEVLKQVVSLAYSVRRYPDFERLLIRICPRGHGHARKIMEKLGKVARFYRSAVTFIRVGRYKFQFCIETVKSIHRHVNVLSWSTAVQIRQRYTSLARLSPYATREIQRLIRRSNDYVVHAEILLLLFYNANPHLAPISNYIGISKRSCFLCSSFLKFHGRFVVEGSHQQLYSLWTLPVQITFKEQRTRESFIKALQDLNSLVVEKVRMLSGPTHQLFKYNSESIANFSRMSLVSVSRYVQPVRPDQHITHDVPTSLVPVEDIPESTESSRETSTAIENDSSQIPEAAMEESVTEEIVDGYDNYDQPDQEQVEEVAQVQEHEDDVPASTISEQPTERITVPHRPLSRSSSTTVTQHMHSLHRGQKSRKPQQHKRRVKKSTQATQSARTTRRSSMSMRMPLFVFTQPGNASEILDRSVKRSKPLPSSRQKAKATSKASVTVRPVWKKLMSRIYRMLGTMSLAGRMGVSKSRKRGHYK